MQRAMKGEVSYVSKNVMHVCFAIYYGLASDPAAWCSWVTLVI